MRRNPSNLPAYYFGVDGEPEQDESNRFTQSYSSTQTSSYGNDPWSCSSSPQPDSFTSSNSSASVVGSLNTHRASLARVVAAFPPSGHALGLQNIADVFVLAVDASHMQVQATICEEESCSAVAVPVTFPHPCGGSGDSSDMSSHASSSASDIFDECVLQNLDALDQEAELLLQHAEYETLNYESQAAKNRQQEALWDPQFSHYPAWWVAPATTELVQDCDTLRRLLNEAEFQADLQSMAKKSLATAAASTIGAVIEVAAVGAVGPAGILLRAKLSGSMDLVEAHVSFPTVATSVDHLRSLVEDAMQ